MNLRDRSSSKTITKHASEKEVFVEITWSKCGSCYRFLEDQSWIRTWRKSVTWISRETGKGKNTQWARNEGQVGRTCSLFHCLFFFHYFIILLFVIIQSANLFFFISWLGGPCDFWLLSFYNLCFQTSLCILPGQNMWILFLFGCILY